MIFSQEKNQINCRIRYILGIIAAVIMLSLELSIPQIGHADTLNEAPPDASDPRTAIVTPTQRDVVQAFIRTLRDYESVNMFGLGSDLTLQAQDAFNSAPRDAFIQTVKEDIAERGIGTLVNPRVLLSADKHYAWLRTTITYSKGGSNTILVMMVQDLFQWKVASIQLT